MVVERVEGKTYKKVKDYLCSPEYYGINKRDIFS